MIRRSLLDMNMLDAVDAIGYDYEKRPARQMARHGVDVEEFILMDPEDYTRYRAIGDIGQQLLRRIRRKIFYGIKEEYSMLVALNYLVSEPNEENVRLEKRLKNVIDQIEKLGGIE